MRTGGHKGSSYCVAMARAATRPAPYSWVAGWMPALRRFLEQGQQDELLLFSRCNCGNQEAALDGEIAAG